MDVCAWMMRKDPFVDVWFGLIWLTPRFGVSTFWKFVLCPAKLSGLVSPRDGGLYLFYTFFRKSNSTRLNVLLSVVLC